MIYLLTATSIARRKESPRFDTKLILQITRRSGGDLSLDAGFFTQVLLIFFPNRSANPCLSSPVILKRNTECINYLLRTGNQGFTVRLTHVVVSGKKKENLAELSGV